MSSSATPLPAVEAAVSRGILSPMTVATNIASHENDRTATGNRERWWAVGECEVRV